MRSDQVTQGIIQLSLKNLQGQRQHIIFGQPVPVFDCPHNGKKKKVFKIRIQSPLLVWPKSSGENTNDLIIF